MDRDQAVMAQKKRMALLRSAFREALKLKLNFHLKMDSIGHLMKDS